MLRRVVTLALVCALAIILCSIPVSAVKDDAELQQFMSDIVHDATAEMDVAEAEAEIADEERESSSLIEVSSDGAVQGTLAPLPAAANNAALAKLSPAERAILKAAQDKKARAEKEALANQKSIAAFQDSLNASEARQQFYKAAPPSDPIDAENVAKAKLARAHQYKLEQCDHFECQNGGVCEIKWTTRKRSKQFALLEAEFSAVPSPTPAPSRRRGATVAPTAKTTASTAKTTASPAKTTASTASTGAPTSAPTATPVTPAPRADGVAVDDGQVGTPYCSCSEKFGGDKCQYNLCASVVCVAGYNCSKGQCVQDQCFRVFCENNGTCESGACVCPKGFGGVFCANVLCDEMKCLNGSRCHLGQCECINGFTGKNCEIDPCSTVACHNEGKCLYGKCICSPGFTGTNCEKLGQAIATKQKLEQALTDAELKLAKLNNVLARAKENVGAHFSSVVSQVSEAISNFQRTRNEEKKTAFEPIISISTLNPETGKMEIKRVPNPNMATIIRQPLYGVQVTDKLLETQNPAWLLAKTYEDEKLAYNKAHEIRDEQLKLADWTAAEAGRQLQASRDSIKRPIPGHGDYKQDVNDARD